MSPQNRLQELRGQIDEINLQILELLNARARIASDIGKVQLELGTSFYDPQREADMIAALEMANAGPFSNETIKALFREVYAYWTQLPRDSRPRLYLFGLSLGALSSEQSMDLFDVIEDPI